MSPRALENLFPFSEKKVKRALTFSRTECKVCAWLWCRSCWRRKEISKKRIIRQAGRILYISGLNKTLKVSFTCWCNNMIHIFLPRSKRKHTQHPWPKFVRGYNSREKAFPVARCTYRAFFIRTPRMCVDMIRDQIFHNVEKTQKLGGCPWKINKSLL